MIPARARPQSNQNNITTPIQDRLALLRSEQRRGIRLSFPSSSDTRSALLASTTSITSGRTVLAQPIVVGLVSSYRSNGIGKSGSVNFNSPTLSSSNVIARRRREIIIAQERRLNHSHHDESSSTLKGICLRLIANNLATSSLHLVLVGEMDQHLKLHLIEVASVYAPLSNAGVLAIFREEAVMEEKEGEEVTKEQEEDWESRIDLDAGLGLPPSTSFRSTLTTLNLSFSTISLTVLRSLLLSPTKRTTSTFTSTSTSTTRHISVFPHLHHLYLAHTPNLPFIGTFFEILHHLLSLQSLSLVGKSTGSTPPHLILPRLATVTPSLVSLNISYTPLTTALVTAVEFWTQWLRLKKLRAVGLGRNLEEIGLGSNVELSTGRQRRILDRGEQETGGVIWDRIKSKMGEGRVRSWIDIET
jgi:hypothetical protein